jgi:hypothetical protein
VEIKTDNNGNYIFTDPNAARIAASTVGVLAEVGVLTHGMGEMLQDNVTPRRWL